MKHFKLLIFTLMLYTASEAVAQTPPSPPGGGGGPDCSTSPWQCIPIDGGASILLGLGLAYGGKKVANSLKEKR